MNIMPNLSPRAMSCSIPPLGLAGTLHVPHRCRGVVVFAHGSGSSRLSPRNVHVASALTGAGFATLLFDLLTEREEVDRANVFDIRLLADRLAAAIDWVHDEPITASLPLGLFGASTGAAAALVASTLVGDRVGAIVSRGGRPDLAGSALRSVTAPTLLIVGGNDPVVLDLNETALRQLRCPKRLDVIPRATHLFPEPGALDAVVDKAKEWFGDHLRPHAG